MSEELLEFTPLFPNDDEETILGRLRGWANEGVDPEADPERWVDTREGSHFHVQTMPLVREFARLYDLAGSDVPASAFPVWAWADYLDDHAELVEVNRLPAVAAEGTVRFEGEPGKIITGGVVVGVGLVDPDADPPEFEVVTGGTIPDEADTPADVVASGVVGGGTHPATTDFGYRVSAYDDAGETLASAAVLGTVPGGGQGRIDVTWDAVPTAIGYRVYRADTLGGSYGLLADVLSPATAFSDTNEVATTPATLPVTNLTGGELVLPVIATQEGVIGNVGGGAITEIVTPGLIDVVVANDEATRGGAEPETDSALRERVIVAYRGKGAGARRDYVRWARAWEGVGRVTVIPLWDGPGTVKVIVSDLNGDPVAPSTVLGLQLDLDPVPQHGEGTAPIGARVTVLTAGTMAVEVGATVEFERGYSLDGGTGAIALRQVIVNALRRYVEGIEPGGEIVIRQIIGRIATVAGVHDVGSVTINGGTVNVAVDDDPPVVPQLAAVDVTLIEGAVA